MYVVFSLKWVYYAKVLAAMVAMVTSLVKGFGWYW